ncbi:membrane protein [Aeromonas veronii]|nr:membrane protein [Aeromonas veronii]
MMDGANMMLQQRVAKHLLLLVCLLVLNCAAQPLARLALLDHALSCQALPVPGSATDQEDAKPASPQPTSCQLNGKWLSAATLLCVEQLFFAVAVLIALLAPLWRYTPPLPPPRVISPPERRLHLTLCVWRE